MTQIPDFSTIDLDLATDASLGTANWEEDFLLQTGQATEAFTWNTPEGIDIKCLYTPQDLSLIHI